MNSFQEIVQKSKSYGFGSSSACLGRTHAGGAALCAEAGFDRFAALLQQMVFQIKKRRAEANPTGKIIIDKNIWLEGPVCNIDRHLLFPELGRDVTRWECSAGCIVPDGDTHIVEVAHHKQGGDMVETVGQSK